MAPLKRSSQNVLQTGGAPTDPRLTSGQNTFAQVLAAQTGLDVNVISAWLLAEESGAAAQQRQASNNHDWLNVGYTDTANLGTANSYWRDPTSAAQATALWMAGKLNVSGFGTASGGIQNILKSAGQPPANQIAAIANSGWASSGYNGGNSLRALYLPGNLPQPTKGAGPLGDIAGVAGDAIGAVTNPIGTVLGILTGGLGSLAGDAAGQVALFVANLAKDAAVSIADIIFVPLWHWNQRSVMYYYQYILVGNSGGWTAIPWNAVFWGVGYRLLWTSPDKGGWKPAPVRQSRLARHVRAAQALPARRALVKPGEVKSKTPKKPTPHVSTAYVRQVTTMTTSRTQTVRVTDARAGNNETAGNRTGKAPEGGASNTAQPQPHAVPGAGTVPSSSSGRSPEDNSGEGTPGGS